MGKKQLLFNSVNGRYLPGEFSADRQRRPDISVHPAAKIFVVAVLFERLDYFKALTHVAMYVPFQFDANLVLTQIGMLLSLSFSIRGDDERASDWRQTSSLLS